MRSKSSTKRMLSVVQHLPCPFYFFATSGAFILCYQKQLKPTASETVSNIQISLV